MSNFKDLDLDRARKIVNDELGIRILELDESAKSFGELWFFDDKETLKNIAEQGLERG